MDTHNIAGKRFRRIYCWQNLLNSKSKKRCLLGIILAGFVMVLVYYLGGVILVYSTEGFKAALFSALSAVPFNILQVISGAIGGSMISYLLKDRIEKILNSYKKI